MTATLSQVPRLLHAVPGRVRVHLPAWKGAGRRQLERRLRQLPGVRKVEANHLTGNVLVQFDPHTTDQQTVLGAVHALEPEPTPAPADEPAPPPVLEEPQQGAVCRARIPVRGLDRDPHLARRVVERLHRFPGVKATASQLTGRVLVLYDAHRVDLEELICEVMDVELPPLPDEDRPTHPLDPLPLVQSATRTAAATLGLGLVTARQLLRSGPPPNAKVFATTASVITLLQSFPFVRHGIRHLVGANAAELAFNVTGIAANSLAGSPLSLGVGFVEALRLLTEVLARRGAWRHYEDRLAAAVSTNPGTVVRLEAGERAPLQARVIEGTGTATARHGLPVPLAPGATVPPGARLSGGPFVLELEGGTSFVPQPRPAPVPPNLLSHYLHTMGPVSFAYAALTAAVTWSPARAFLALLLVNPRTAIIGTDTANLSAAAQVLRAGVTVVGSRADRVIRLPDVLLLDGPRLLTDGVEIARVVPLTESWEPAEIISLAAGVAAAAGSPWGKAFPSAGHAAATDGYFDGHRAGATVAGARYSLRPVSADDEGARAVCQRHPGEYLLLLAGGREQMPLGVLALRPCLAPHVHDLVRTCRRLGVELAMLPGHHTHAAEALRRRVGVPVITPDDATAVVRARQAEGKLVALVSDSAHAAEAFAACDLAIGLVGGRNSRFPARADLLAPDLRGVADILEAGARREKAVRDSIFCSVLANLFGAVWGFRGQPGVESASNAMHTASLAAILAGWVRMRGGERPGSSLGYLVDPRPERWGRRSVPSVLHAFHSRPTGLTDDEAAQRQRHAVPSARRHELLKALLDQLRYPMTSILAGGAGVSLVLGETMDAAIIAATVAVNIAVGTWQERQTGRTAEALERLGTATGRVLRDGRTVTVPATALVPGDVLVLAPGDRVAADARLLEAHGLEVDEAALTGESLPVAKQAEGGPPESHVLLEGSDVVVGRGRAVVVAVGRQTRLGATRTALNLEQSEQSPLGVRLSRLFNLSLPLAVGGGAITLGSGLLRGRPFLPQLAVGASIALAVVPEGLPLLAGVGAAAIARRLLKRQAIVHRLAAIEALGRVDVVCTDKTGTLTEGRLCTRLVADVEREAHLPGELPDDLRGVLLTAALACPHPDAADAAAHPTDVAVVRGAQTAGLAEELRAPRTAEAPFDPSRSFHAAVVDGRLCVKGAPEVVAARCGQLRRAGGERPLDEAGREVLLARARRFAEQGLRVLLVAEGPGTTVPNDPQGLTALGFVGISDPLRPGVAETVSRCHEAGVRVVMLTGDHPATARAIAREAGLLDGSDEVITGAELADLHNGELERRLEHARVIARATPLDKVRIVEGLQRLGHTVAMTGDGVNDAPSLRLADVGVAMGRGGTEVARQAADLVLGDDDFATLVETFIEGRSFWQNIRRGMGLLLGGNLGELGLIVGATALGLPSPLNTRQILMVNLITDALPALSVVLQAPEHRRLASLAREGTAALDATLHFDVWRRGLATAAPALGAYLVARSSGSLPQASGVAFASIVAGQLAQTLEAGRVEGSLSPSVLAAVASSGGILLGALTVPPLRNLLGLEMPTPEGWSLVGASVLTTLALNGALSAARGLFTRSPDGLNGESPYPFPHLLPGPAAEPAHA